jgi:hypothetical protein
MTTLARLEAPALDVAPGGEAETLLTIRNTGDIVEAYHFEVLGDAGRWTTVEPPAVSVFPGTEEQARVVFRPPRAPWVAPGETPFAVRVIPTERPEGVVVPEGAVQVLPYSETTAEILPRTSRGRRNAKHEIAIDNRGNTPLRVGINGADPDGALAFSARPPTVAVPPGEAVFASLKVRHRRRLWRGQPVTRPFQALVVAENHPPLTLDAATLQDPVVPRWSGRAAALAALALLALAGLWFGILRPAVQSAAKDAVATPLRAAEKKATAAQDTAQRAEEKVDTAVGPNPGRPLPTPSGGRPPVVAPPPVKPGTVTAPFGDRLEVEAAAGRAGTDTFTSASRTTLVVTDLILQNPQGDVGRVDVIVDNKLLLTLALANFRDIDYHFVSPLEITPGRTVRLRVTCQAPGPRLAGTGSDRCRAFMTMAGTTRKAPAPAPVAPAAD